MLGTRLMLLALVLTGCRTFNYTEADMRKERLWISGCPNKPCQNSCWHQGHRHDREFLLGWDITGAEGRR